MRRRVRRSLVAAGVTAIALLVVVLLTFVPVYRRFSMTGVRVYDLQTSCAGISTLGGTLVTFHWSAPSNITFGSWSCAKDRIVYETTGMGGDGSFWSGGGVYEFGSVCPPVGSPQACTGADVQGNYTAPLLVL